MTYKILLLAILGYSTFLSACSETKKTENQDSSKPPIEEATFPTEVEIGAQTWSTINLNVAQFNNGDKILEAKTNADWKTAGIAKKAAWCYAENDTANGKTLGKLYNYFALIDSRGIAPKGFIIPSDVDFSTLIETLGSKQIAREKLILKDGFNAHVQGSRNFNGIHFDLGYSCFWTSENSDSLRGTSFFVGDLKNGIGTSLVSKKNGYSIRCIKK